MKVLRGIGIILMVVAAAALILLLFSFVNHRIRLDREEQLLQSADLGRAVEVNGHLMNVYQEGDGEETLVFLSGGGTSSPVLDFRSLYSLLRDDYRIAVVEKAGYGLSDISGEASRDIGTILEETREALKLSGIEGSYVLLPHSMSGIEALYWAQTYPEEVRAIVGLDMAFPAVYQDYPINMGLIRLTAFGARIGVTRLIPGVAESDAIRYGTLTAEEEALYRAIFYRRTATPDMLNEVAEIKTNAALVGAGTRPAQPMLVFSSNGEGTGWDEADWRAAQKSFAKEMNAALVELDCSHYVHDIEYERIAAEIARFLEG